MKKSLIILLAIPLLLSVAVTACQQSVKKRNPNVIYVLTDQWRAQDLGYTGNKQVKTPILDDLARESIVFTNAVSNCPVCSPARASLLTGQYPLRHGVFYNDKPLATEAITMAKIYKENGYQTAYIGKWHVNGHEKGMTTQDGRTSPVPQERRQGFEYWKVNECTHAYNNSVYFDENDEKHLWEGYDAIAQTGEAIEYINNHKDDPFLLVISYGPPHAPYQTAPDKYKAMYLPDEMTLRPNVPEDLQETAREAIAGYYAHCTALDDCMGVLLEAMESAGLVDNTILVFTSDHGDMLYSHGMTKKQKPWEESIMVPFTLRYPELFGEEARSVDLPFGTPDIMPTLLELSGLEIPESVEGTSYAGHLRGEEDLDIEAALIMCPVPFHQWSYLNGGREYRGVRTRQYTYARDLDGPWILYDNDADPFQQHNLVGDKAYTGIQTKLDKELDRLLLETKDDFTGGIELMRAWNYDFDNNDDSIPAGYLNVITN